MRICFWRSRSGFDRVANEALADPVNAHLLAGRWAGLYRIEGVEVIGSTVALFLDADKGTSGSFLAHNATTHQISDYQPIHVSSLAMDYSHPDWEGKRIKDDWFVMFARERE